MNNLVLFLATLGPIGTKLPAPGTMGSLFGTLLFAFFTVGLGWSVYMIAVGFIPLFFLAFPCVPKQKFCSSKTTPEKLYGTSLRSYHLFFSPFLHFLKMLATRRPTFGYWLDLFFSVFLMCSSHGLFGLPKSFPADWESCLTISLPHLLPPWSYGQPKLFLCLFSLERSKSVM